MQTEFQRELAGRTLTLEFGGVAKQANGSVLVRYGETVVLVTATMSKEPRTGIDFFPLLVDYEERMYAVGQFPVGGDAESRPSEEAILSARDRPSCAPSFQQVPQRRADCRHSNVCGQEQFTHYRSLDRSKCSAHRIRHSLQRTSWE